MAKRDRTTTHRKIDKWIKEGRGQGEGVNYKPWLTIQDVPSEGRVSRIKGWKTGRVHHLMSKLELSYFYVAEWSPRVIDIMEQYPLLPLERTLEIAEELGIQHPLDPVSKQPIVMTTDFVLVVSHGDQQRCLYRTIKPAGKLNKRQLDKFRIEHRYYLEQDCDWGIVTDHDIPVILSRNVDFLHNFRTMSENMDINEEVLEIVAPTLFEAMLNSTLPVSREGLRQDKLLGFEPGTSVTIAKHMIANKAWVVDMETKELKFTKYCLAELLEPATGGPSS